MADSETYKSNHVGKRICLMTETFHPVTGGGETQARVLARGLSEAGHNVHVITRRSARELPRREEMEGFIIWRLAPNGPGQLKKWGMVAFAFFKLLRLRKEYDMVLVCGYRILGIAAVAATRILRKRCVLKADSLGEYSGEFFRAGLGRLGFKETNPVFRFMLRRRNRLLAKATCFVAISSSVEQELTGAGIARERIVPIPNSVDLERFSPPATDRKMQLRAQLGIPLDARVGVYTGRLVTTKGLPGLVRVWEKVVGRHPDAFLLLVGSGGLGIQNCESELREFVRAAELKHSIRFTGSVENVDDFLQASDFFVFPTEREAFGISVIEAMSCGLPVVTTMAGGLADIVTPDHDAITIPVSDEIALEQAIEGMFDSWDRMTVIGKAGRETVLARYAENRVIREYERLFEPVLPSDSGNDRKNVTPNMELDDHG
jgi:glycosyltransferase involved in cell wall biosynthesis